MDRSQKTELVSEMRERLTASSLVVVAHQYGLTVSEATDLRRKVRESSAEFKVLKNTLAHLAVQETPLSGLSEFFKGPTTLAFSKDPVSAAKAVVGFASKNDKLKVIGGYLDGQLLSAAAIKALSELPSLDELRARLLSVISASATQIARILIEPGTQVARVIAAKAKG